MGLYRPRVADQSPENEPDFETKSQNGSRSMRYACRRDLNEAEIVDAVTKAGFEIMDFSRAGQSIPDKLAFKSLADGTQFICWLEIKSKHGKTSKGQNAFRDIFRPRGEWIEARDCEQTINELQRLYLASRPEHHR